jgi:hypothetical protein
MDLGGVEADANDIGGIGGHEQAEPPTA